MNTKIIFSLIILIGLGLTLNAQFDRLNYTMRLSERALSDMRLTQARMDNIPYGSQKKDSKKLTLKYFKKELKYVQQKQEILKKGTAGRDDNKKLKELEKKIALYDSMGVACQERIKSNRLSSINYYRKVAKERLKKGKKSWVITFENMAKKLEEKNKKEQEEIENYKNQVYKVKGL